MDALDYDLDIKEVPRLRSPRHRWEADRLKNPQLTVSFLPFVTNMPHTKRAGQKSKLPAKAREFDVPMPRQLKLPSF
jgi:hypothetical protein